MSRRRRAIKRPIPPDPRYNSTLVMRLVNTVMRRGKKSVAMRIVYSALEKIAEKSGGTNPLDVLQRAVENAKPRIETKARRVGGATYQVPMEVPPDRQLSLALAAEILDAYQGQGSAIRKRDEVHKMAQANKAFAHFRW